MESTLKARRDELPVQHPRIRHERDVRIPQDDDDDVYRLDSDEYNNFCAAFLSTGIFPFATRNGRDFFLPGDAHKG